MKAQNLKRLVLALTIFGLILAVPATAAADDNHCGARGTYAYTGFGYTYEGNILGLPAGNLSVSGTITLDGKGNSFIHQWEVINGVLLSPEGADYTGTYTLNPDCTFSATLTGLPGPAFVGVVADNGKQIRAMITAPGVQVNFTNTTRAHP